jgi:hypothetical protein
MCTAWAKPGSTAPEHPPFTTNSLNHPQILCCSQEGALHFSRVQTSHTHTQHTHTHIHTQHTHTQHTH